VATIREEAQALRAGLIGRWITLSEVVSWADARIAEDAGRETPQLFDLALLRADAVGQAVSLLGSVPGPWNPGAVGRRIAVLVHRGLRTGALTERQAATALYVALREGLSPDAEFEGMAYYFDDGVDLANNGVFGSLAELRVEMLDYLSRVDDSA